MVWGVVIHIRQTDSLLINHFNLFDHQVTEFYHFSFQKTETLPVLTTKSFFEYVVSHEFNNGPLLLL